MSGNSAMQKKGEPKASLSKQTRQAMNEHPDKVLADAKSLEPHNLDIPLPNMKHEDNGWGMISNIKAYPDFKN
jgi:hypothetical protein